MYRGKSINVAQGGTATFFVQGADDLYIADVRQGELSILVSGIDVRNATPAPFKTARLRRQYR